MKFSKKKIKKEESLYVLIIAALITWLLNVQWDSNIIRVENNELRKMCREKMATSPALAMLNDDE